MVEVRADRAGALLHADHLLGQPDRRAALVLGLLRVLDQMSAAASRDPLSGAQRVDHEDIGELQVLLLAALEERQAPRGSITVPKRPRSTGVPAKDGPRRARRSCDQHVDAPLLDETYEQVKDVRIGEIPAAAPQQVDADKKQRDVGREEERAHSCFEVAFPLGAGEEVEDDDDAPVTHPCAADAVRPRRGGVSARP